MGNTKLPLSHFFRAERGKSRYTRQYGDDHPGPYPVYSASNAGPLCWINDFDYQGTWLTFATNGYAGSMQLISGTFSLNGDRALLVPVDGVEIPDLAYLEMVAEPVLRALAVGRRGDRGKNEYTKLSPERALEAEIPVAIDDIGRVDYERMAEIGNGYLRAKRLQVSVRDRASELSSVQVVIDHDHPLRSLSLGDASAFQLSIGKRVLNDDLAPHGEVPVYSANARVPMGFADGPPDGVEFRHASLIWGIDGIFDWNLIPPGVPFVPTDHCGRAEVLDPSLDPLFLLHYLRSTRAEAGFDRVYRANLRNIAALEVPVPVGSDGIFDITAQRLLAARYEAIEKSRERVIEAAGRIARTRLVAEP